MLVEHTCDGLVKPTFHPTLNPPRHGGISITPLPVIGVQILLGAPPLRGGPACIPGGPDEGVR